MWGSFIYRLGLSFLLLISFGSLARCAPTSAPQLKLFQKDEVSLPNGTVVGKYSYYDKDGALINVKYFANDRSYGVELNSIKSTESVVGQKASLRSTEGEEIFSDETLTHTLNPNHNSEQQKKQLRSFGSYMKKYDRSSHRSKNDFGNSDYEVFVKNKLVGSKCGKDKVQIYSNKIANKRNRRRPQLFARNRLNFCHR